MEPMQYFEQPKSVQQRQYEALRASYAEKDDLAKIAKKFGFSPAYLKKLRTNFRNEIQNNGDPFFITKKRGPKQRRANQEVIEKIIALRKQNYSIIDIKVNLGADNKTLSVDTIDNILKSAGFAPLPKRTRQERLSVQLPKEIKAPKAAALEIKNEIISTEMHAGPLIFLPLIEELGIVDAIKRCAFPSTQEISDVQYIMSFLALKLIGGARLSHDALWNFDRALGFFAGLNVLPKSTALSTYSYRVSRQSNIALLISMAKIFDLQSDGEFNLDFKTIPHWGDASVLENNWCGSRGKVVKSILSVIVQNPTSGMLSYTDAEIKHRDQNEAIIEFVDFWKTSSGNVPKVLIFDSKFTTYENLNKLNQDGIMFLTLRRRGRNIVNNTNAINDSEWQKVQVERAKNKKATIRVCDRITSLRNYDGQVREIIITDNGHQKPAFLITNDLNSNIKTLVKKYARRWLVEQEIAEQVAFFQINHPSSSVVVKVDFDLTLSLLAHNLYRKLAKELVGFEHCTAETIHRNFLLNGADIQIKDNQATVQLKKKTHLPLLLHASWMKKNTNLSWQSVNINYEGRAVS
jgi:hypothetical protein